MTAIPDTEFTRQLHTLWSCTDGTETWEAWYARQSRGGTTNGRINAAILFDHAHFYWPDFFTAADAPAVAIWATVLDNVAPLATPEAVIKAVDAVFSVGVEPDMCHFTRAIHHAMEGHFDQ